MVGQGFQLAGHGPEAYEQYLVPVFFAPCAEQLFDFAPPGRGGRVLDVACGTGIVARRAASAVGAAGTVAGTDVNDGMIEQARASGMDAITWHSADAAALPFAGGAFDVVYCQQGLQFFADRPAALREMHRVLAPGGRVALAIWLPIDQHPVFAALVSVLGRHAGEEAAAMMRAPFAGPRRAQIRDLLAGAGFTRATVRIGIVSVRFPSVPEFLRQEALSSPLAGPVGALDEQRYAELGNDLAVTLSGQLDDDGLAFPMQTWLATAYR
jgi:ubiquinone/menaquinone biosynthesis C-methylase UbiE